jgi:hypothetical protein
MSWGIKPILEDGKDPESVVYSAIMSSRLKGVEDGPVSAAEIAEGVIETWLKAAASKKDFRMIVRRIARGTMRGMSEIGQDLPQTARFLLKLKYTPDPAPERAVEAKEMSAWILEGIADVTLMTGPAPRANILKMIDYDFPELSAPFSEICRKAKVKQWWTK